MSGVQAKQQYRVFPQELLYESPLATYNLELEWIKAQKRGSKIWCECGINVMWTEEGKKQFPFRQKLVWSCYKIEFERETVIPLSKYSKIRILRETHYDLDRDTLFGMGVVGYPKDGTPPHVLEETDYKNSQWKTLNKEDRDWYNAMNSLYQFLLANV